jgi:tRNA threonylcarbamoyl adenosine modification protein (Sua5/YciO/YrdC/YwlC family)
MSAIILGIHNENPDGRKITNAIAQLRQHAVMIFPTDTVYALGCSMHSPTAIEKIYRLKKSTKSKQPLTLLCSSISQVAEYVSSINNAVFAIMKRTLPGPYTFIFEAGKNIPKALLGKRKEIGIRIPNNKICLALLTEIGSPLLSTSLHHTDEVVDYYIALEEFYSEYENGVELMIDGGNCGKIPSTILNVTGKGIELVRLGAGDWPL